MNQRGEDFISFMRDWLTPPLEPQYETPTQTLEESKYKPQDVQKIKINADKGLGPHPHLSHKKLYSNSDQ